MQLFVFILFAELVILLEQGGRYNIQLLYLAVIVHQTIFLDGSRGLTPEGQLEHDGGKDGAAHNGDDDGGHEILAEHSHGKTTVGNDQGNLTTAGHTSTDLDAFVVLELAYLGAQATADDLGQDGYSQQAEGEENQGKAQLGENYLGADAGKEDGGKQQVAESLKLGLDILGFGGGGNHQTGSKSADDVGNAEELLSAVGQQKAENEGQHRIPAQIPDLLHPAPPQLFHFPASLPASHRRIPA